MSKLLQFISGQKVGEMTFIKELPKKGKYRMGLFLCHCGKETEKRIDSAAKAKGCGCSPYNRMPPSTKKDYQKGDMVGNDISYLKDTKIVGKGKRYCLFMCYCGKEFEARMDGIKNLSVKSCGCRRVASNIERFTKHGLSASEEYRIYVGMKGRCENRNDDMYHHYGGRGIRVCERWLGENGFENFYKDMGPRPSKDHSIDRYPNNDTGIYEPMNCRWATEVEQQNNKRDSRFLTIKGERLTLAEWARKTGVNRKTLWCRLKCGWTPEQAITTQIFNGGGNKTAFPRIPKSEYEKTNGPDFIPHAFGFIGDTNERHGQRIEY